MKNHIYVLFILLFLTASCSSSDDDQVAPVPIVNQAAVNGWWYRPAGAPIYRAYYFGADGEYKQDMGNFGLGMGLGTWSWETATQIKMVPTPGGGIAGGTMYLSISRLSQDSLVSPISSHFKLSRINHN